MDSTYTVSYTHLDVYKRQAVDLPKHDRLFDIAKLKKVEMYLFDLY